MIAVPQVVLSRGFVGQKSTLEMLGITPNDFKLLEKIATVGMTDLLAVPVDAAKRLERAGLVFVTWLNADETGTGEADWLNINPKPAGLSLLELVNSVHVTRGGTIDPERI